MKYTGKVGDPVVVKMSDGTEVRAACTVPSLHEGQGVFIRQNPDGTYDAY